MNFLKKLVELNIPIGTWFGVPVRLHWSWLLLLVVFLFFSPVLAVVYVGIFSIVLLHEFGHCFAGMCYNCYIRDIVLYPFGGAAAMHIPARPKEELVVALAGPAVNVLLLPVLWPLAGFHAILSHLALANTVLLVFNLVPAFPMDGGRVLRAALTWWLGDHYRATRYAVNTAKVFCFLFVVLGAISLNVMLLLIAILIYNAGQNELSQIRLRRLFESQTDDEIKESLKAIADVRRELDELAQRRSDEAR
jgi:Zn-dependent protease